MSALVWLVWIYLYGCVAMLGIAVGTFIWPEGRSRWVTVLVALWAVPLWPIWIVWRMTTGGLFR